MNVLKWIVPAALVAVAFVPVDLEALTAKNDAITRMMEVKKSTDAFAKSMAKHRQKFINENGATSSVTFSDWFYQGPVGIKNFGVETDIEKGKYDLNDSKKWSKKNWADGKKHNFPNQKGSAAHFLVRKITATSDVELEIRMGSDDGITGYINGKRFLRNDCGRGVEADQEIKKIKLVKGENILMLRIFNRNGATGFYFKPYPAYPMQGIWDKIVAKYPDASEIQSYDASFGPAWLSSNEPKKLELNFLEKILPKQILGTVKDEIEKDNDDASRIVNLMKYVTLVNQLAVCKAQIELIDAGNLLKSVNDLERNHPGQLSNAKDIRATLDSLSPKIPDLRKKIADNDFSAVPDAQRLIDLQKEVVFAYPEIAAVKDILVVKRQTRNGNIPGLPANWQGNSSIGSRGYDNELGRIDVRTGNFTPIYRAPNNGFIGDLELNFDADKLLFSSSSENGRFQVFEINVDGTNAHEITPKGFKDIDNYEGMYLPDGRIIFTSSATFVGVPCVAGGDYVGNIHIMNADGTGVRRLCFDQDNNWCPVLLEDGRILYLRWEYTDSGHYFSRILMHMNPDGTGQNEFYGSNSYWPNSMFYARPIPGSTTKFVSVVSGHHGTARAGELYLFDTTKGREETQGVVQQIAPHNVQGISKGLVMDRLVDDYNAKPKRRYITNDVSKKASWPKFLYPHPLSEKQYLVSARPQNGVWGLYFIDLNGNMTLIAQDPSYAYLEPTPIMKTKRPPIIPDHVNLDDPEATVYIQDVYEGTGLPGVPRGVVKGIRVFQYEYSYRNMGGHYAIGMESGWDVRRIIGTAPVNEDGSAIFKIPANTPVALQPVDAEGRALQQMRSWTVGMPGEIVQCVGCHERQNQTVRPTRTKASQQEAKLPEPFYGPKRGFSFNREVQPVLNRHCISCHNPKNAKIPDFSNTAIDETDKNKNGGAINTPWHQSGYSYAYWALMPYVRRNGPEGNYKILIPGEFHAHTSELVQLLEKGHHGVKLDKESWDRIYTWIDLNVPFHGTWTEVAAATGRKIPNNFQDRRLEFRKLYSKVNEDIEAPTRGIPYNETPATPIETAIPKVKLSAKDWPFDSATARELQTKAGTETKVVDLGDGQKITFVRIPAGEFNMGSETGAPDEMPVNTVVIEKPFWMATTEVTLAQFKKYDPAHNNYYYDQHYKDQVRQGYDMNDDPNFPAIRVSWAEAMNFCQWLGQKAGGKVTLPTEAQWEWAARAGTNTPMWYGNLGDDFSKKANLADRSLRQMAVQGIDPTPMGNPTKYWDFLPQIKAVNDGWMLLSPVGIYEANRWGLKDMAGNVVEWCRDNYRPYPYKYNPDDVNSTPTDIKSARGGSWFDRPYRATSSYRFNYPAWQKVYNVGFRPIIEE